MTSDNRISPSLLARQAVSAWNSLNYNSARAYELRAAWNELVEAFGEDEAENLVFLVISARGASDPSYEANSLRWCAHKLNEERENDNPEDSDD